MRITCSKPTPTLANNAAHLLESVAAAVINAAGFDLGHGLGTMDPGDAVVPGDDQLLADPLDLHFTLAAADAQGLDRQQLALAGRLGDVARGGQLAAVEVADHPPALVHLIHVGQKHGLMNDRIGRAFLLDHGLDGAEGIVGLLAESRAAAGNRGRKHMTHVVQVDGRKANTLVDYLADHMRGHTNLLISWVPNSAISAAPIHSRRSGGHCPTAVCHAPNSLPLRGRRVRRRTSTPPNAPLSIQHRYLKCESQGSVALSSGGSTANYR